MASTINQVTLLGNVGADPEVKVHGDTKVARFRMAITKKWKDAQGAEHEQTTWVGVKCFGHAANYVEQYIGRGMRLCLTGEPREERWEADRQKRSVLMVYAQTLVPFEPRREGQPPTSQEPTTTQRAAAATAPRGNLERAEPPKQAASSTSSAQGSWDDDIPF